MASAAGARAEIALRHRHREAWPRSLYAYDHDEMLRVSGITPLLEVPRGELALAAEYKAVDEGPLDLNGLQYRVVADSIRPDLPVFAIQFTHPRLVPPQPWAFRLWPINEPARGYVDGSVTLTEADYVRLHYLLIGGPLGAGGRVDVGHGRRGQVTSVETLMPPWSEVAHLDSAFPDEGWWPEVEPARRRRFPDLYRPWKHAVRGFLSDAGRIWEQAAAATVVRLPPLRPLEPVAPGPVSEARRILAGRRLVAATTAEVVAVTTPDPLAEAKARFAALRREVAAMHATTTWGSPSDDNRDRWRAWNEDGSRRWGRTG